MELNTRSSWELYSEVTQQRASDLSEVNYIATMHHVVQVLRSTATSTTTTDQAHPAEHPPPSLDPTPCEEDRHAKLRSHKRAFDRVDENCELYRAAAEGKKVDLVFLHFLPFARRIIWEMDSRGKVEHELVEASTETVMKMVLDTHRIVPQQGETSDPYRTVSSGKGFIQYGIHLIYVLFHPPSDDENPLHVIIALAHVSPKATKSYQSTPLKPPKAFNKEKLPKVSLAITNCESENGLEATGLPCWHGTHDAGVTRPVPNVPNLVLLVRGGGPVKPKGRSQLTELIGQALKHVFNPSSFIDLNANLTFNDARAPEWHFHAPVHLQQFLVWVLWGAPRQAMPIRD